MIIRLPTVVETFRRHMSVGCTNVADSLNDTYLLSNDRTKISSYQNSSQYTIKHIVCLVVDACRRIESHCRRILKSSIIASKSFDFWRKTILFRHTSYIFIQFILCSGIVSCEWYLNSID